MMSGIPVLQQQYRDHVVKHMMDKFGYKSVMQVPQITKITLNMGLKAGDKKLVTAAVADMDKIAGQKSQVTHSRLSIAGFKIREGWPIGCKVTLRRTRMYDFLDRLVSIAIPRIRDFRGLKARSFDGRGNYSMGIKEQIVFPEINYDDVDAVRGLDIIITTNAKTDAEGFALLAAFNFPFRDKLEQDKAEEKK
jgi:large subunit ribosomal protein L5